MRRVGCRSRNRMPDYAAGYSESSEAVCRDSGVRGFDRLSRIGRADHSTTDPNFEEKKKAKRER